MNKITTFFSAHHAAGIAAGAAAGALLGHFLIKKGNMWTLGLAAVGAIGGYLLGHSAANSLTPPAVATAPASSGSPDMSVNGMSVQS